MKKEATEAETEKQKASNELQKEWPATASSIQMQEEGRLGEARKVAAKGTKQTAGVNQSESRVSVSCRV